MYDVCYMRMCICYVSFCNHCMSFYHVVILILISAVRCVSSIKRVLFSTKRDSTQPVAAFTNTTWLTLFVELSVCLPTHLEFL